MLLQVCDAIWTVLAPAYVQLPQSPQEWLQKAHKFENRWNYPLCVGALDGKHVQIQVGISSFIYLNMFPSIALM